MVFNNSTELYLASKGAFLPFCILSASLNSAHLSHFSIYGGPKVNSSLDSVFIILSYLAPLDKFMALVCTLQIPLARSRNNVEYLECIRDIFSRDF